MKKTRHKDGKYKPEYAEMLIKHMEQGNSFWSFAAEIDATFDMLDQWSKHHEEFGEARRLGEAKLLKFDETIGKAGMLGKLPKFNVRVWEMIMKNRWRDFYHEKRQLEVKFQRAEELQALSDDELQALLNAELKNGFRNI